MIALSSLDLTPIKFLRIDAAFKNFIGTALCKPTLPAFFKYQGNSFEEARLEMMIVFIGLRNLAISEASIPPKERPIKINASSFLINEEKRRA